MSKIELKVTGVRYFNTRRGLGYECKTNIDGVSIWNDGDGSGTCISNVASGYTARELHQMFFKDIPHGSFAYEEALEKLIDEYEGVGIKT